MNKEVSTTEGLAWIVGSIALALGAWFLTESPLSGFLAILGGLMIMPIAKRLLKLESISQSSISSFGVVLFIVSLFFIGGQEDTAPQVVPSKEPLTENAILVEHKIHSEQDLSYAGCKRVGIKVQILDSEAEQSNIDFTLKKIAEDNIDNWDDVTIWGYSENSNPELSAADKGFITIGDCS